MDADGIDYSVLYLSAAGISSEVICANQSSRSPSRVRVGLQRLDYVWTAASSRFVAQAILMPRERSDPQLAGIGLRLVEGLGGPSSNHKPTVQAA